MSKPNLLYLHSHDTGRYVQPYGHAIATPNIQRLAEEGVLFRQAFCAGPTCSPSRAALLTGQAPHSSGMIGLAHRGFRLKDPTQVMTHALRQAGYQTTLAGMQHIATWKEVDQIGYDRKLNSGTGRFHDVSQAAAAFLLDRPKEPFFLDVGFSETHREFPEPHIGDDPRYCLPPAPLPDTPETRRDMSAFKTIARELDAGMGRVLEALSRSGLAQNTLVICTTDHGIAFPHMKCNLTDHGLGVMLILRGPAGRHLVGGKVIDGMVSHVDLFPTVCELVGMPQPAWLQGVSLMPLVRGETRQVREELFGEVTYHAAYEPMRSIRTPRYKYIRRYDSRPQRVLPNVDDGYSKKYLLENGWKEQPLAEEALYDLSFDPCETANVAARPELTGVLNDLRRRLNAWMQKTNDPLLKGPVPAPSGAKVNTVDGLSPGEPTTEIP